MFIVDNMLSPLATRALNQFSENAKKLVFPAIIPEATHSSLNTVRHEDAFLFIVRRSSAEPLISRIYEFLDTLDVSKFFLDVDDKSFSWRSLLEPTFVIDLLSVFTAERLNRNAEEISIIMRAKQWLKDFNPFENDLL